MGLFGFGKKEKDKMKDGLEKTRTGFWGNILNTLTGSKIDDDLYDELEEQLILADVGGDVAMKLVDALRDRVQDKGLKTTPVRAKRSCWPQATPSAPLPASSWRSGRAAPVCRSSRPARAQTPPLSSSTP